MLIIISPSKTQNETTTIVQKVTRPVFNKEATTIGKILKTFSKQELMDNMKLSEALSEKVFQYYRNFRTQSETGNGYPALLAFKGEMYKYIQASQFE